MAMISSRYLLVRGGGETTIGDTPAEQAQEPTIPLVTLDPAHPLKLMSNHTCKTIEIPQPSYQLEKLLAARQAEFLDEDPDEEDVAVFEANENQTQSSQKQREVIDIDSDDDVGQSKTSGARRQRGDSDWTHDATWVMESVVNVMPPPLEWTPSATMAVQRELRAMLREQKAAASLSELGWYLPPEQVGDNLFQWIVELHSFDAELPIAKDMKAKWVFLLFCLASDIEYSWELGRLDRSFLRFGSHHRFLLHHPSSGSSHRGFCHLLRAEVAMLREVRGMGTFEAGRILIVICRIGGSICMDLLTSDGDKYFFCDHCGPA